MYNISEQTKYRILHHEKQKKKNVWYWCAWGKINVKYFFTKKFVID